MCLGTQQEVEVIPGLPYLFFGVDKHTSVWHLWLRGPPHQRPPGHRLRSDLRTGARLLQQRALGRPPHTIYGFIRG